MNGDLRMVLFFLTGSVIAALLLVALFWHFGAYDRVCWI